MPTTTPMLTIPTTAVADLTANVSTLFGDVWVLMALIIGLPLGFYVIKKVIGLFPKR